MDWSPDKHPRDSSGRWAAAQTFADAANAHLDRAEADAKRIGSRLERRARQEYADERIGKKDGEDPDADGRTADADASVVSAVSDVVPGPMLDAFGGDVADAMKERLASGKPITEDDWRPAVDEWRETQADKAQEAGKAAVPAKYHGFIDKHADAISLNLQEHGRVDARRAFAKSEMALSAEPPEPKPMTDIPTTAPFYLFAGTAGDAREAVSLGLPKTRNGFQCHYFWRQAIPDGEFTHPVKKWKLAVDPKQRKEWEQNFRQMAKHGEEVPVVEDHADTKSRATLGYVADVRQNGQWYEELHQYLGDSARDIALRNKISIGIDPDYSTGTGVKLGSCIIHSATTPRPVVPGQGEAVPYAASRGPAGDVLELSAALQEPEMDLSNLRKALGAAENVADAEIIRLAAEKVTGIPAAVEAATQSLSRENETLKTANATLELSRDNKPAQPDEFTLSLLGRQIKTDRTQAIASGGISQAGADAIDALFLKNGKPTTLALSRTEGDTDPLVCRIYEVLKTHAGQGVKHGNGVERIEASRQGGGNAIDLQNGTVQQTPEELEAAVQKNLESTSLGRRFLESKKAG